MGFSFPFPSETQRAKGLVFTVLSKLPADFPKISAYSILDFIKIFPKSSHKPIPKDSRGDDLILRYKLFMFQTFHPVTNTSW